MVDAPATAADSAVPVGRGQHAGSVGHVAQRRVRCLPGHRRRRVRAPGRPGAAALFGARRQQSRLLHEFSPGTEYSRRSGRTIVALPA